MHCEKCRSWRQIPMEEVYKGRDTPPNSVGMVNYTLYRCSECLSERKLYHHAFGPSQVAQGPFNHQPERKRESKQATKVIVAGAIILFGLILTSKKKKDE